MMKKEDIKVGDKVFVTKYCLSEGILETYVKRISKDNLRKYFYAHDDRGLNKEIMLIDGEIYLTIEEALECFEKLKKKRIISLERNICKIENMKANIINYE